jgi:hypothetical protein
MGLLNDAIREHLELKRQHGADPGEVARLEHEALGVSGHEDLSDQIPSTGGYPESSPEPASDSEALPDTSRDVAVTGQETAELDMQTVLSDHPAPSPTAKSEGDLEDSAASTDDRQPGPNDQGGEAVVGDAINAPDGDHDDVLEETPDFLQETPEHERLWFEQRPPRDFDFDK